MSISEVDGKCELIVIFSSTEEPPECVMVSDYDNYTSETLQQYEPPSDDFSVSFGFKSTKQILTNLTADEAIDKFYDLFRTECTVTGAGSIYFQDSNDVIVQPTLYGTLDNLEEPYCGRYSIRNPTIVWRHDRTRDERTEELVDRMLVSSFGYRYVSNTCKC